jgi:hypothetical protein
MKYGKGIRAQKRSVLQGLYVKTHKSTEMANKSCYGLLLHKFRGFGRDCKNGKKSLLKNLLLDQTPPPLPAA